VFLRETFRPGAVDDAVPSSPHADLMTTALSERSPALRDRILLAVVEAVVYLRHARLVWAFARRLGYLPHIARPRTVHEKYLWRKIFDHDPLQTIASDKLAAKAYVRERLPGIGIPETFWVGTRMTDCPDEILAGDVAVKASHGWNLNHFVRGGLVDRAALGREAARWLAVDHSRDHGQWAYRNVERRLFAEELLIDNGKLAEREYKVYVTAGRAVYTYVSYDRLDPDRAQTSDLYEPDGTLIPGDIDIDSPRRYLPAPAQYAEIVAAAETAGRDFDLVRCDFYLHRGRVWFSELTIYSAAGYAYVRNQRTMNKLNAAWDLRRSWLLTTAHRGWRAAYSRALARSLAPRAHSR
jgi:TupA-like ATPgrasp